MIVGCIQYDSPYLLRKRIAGCFVLIIVSTPITDGDIKPWPVTYVRHSAAEIFLTHTLL